jgi:hypothetical protein
MQCTFIGHFAVRGAPGVLVFHVPNGSHRKPVEAAILKGLGVRAGVPDVIAVKDGRTYALEIKPPGGRLTAVQNAAHVNAALAQLEQWGLLRGRASGWLP